MRLRRQRRRAIALAILGFVGTPISMFAWMMGLSLAGDSVAIGLSSLIGGFVLIFACVMLGYKQTAHLRVLQRELRQGKLQRFVGNISDIDNSVVAGIIGRFMRKVGIEPTDGDVCVEISGGSGRVLRINDQLYHGSPIYLKCSETAQPPEFASIAAQWLEKIGETDSGETVLGGRRELSMAELTELKNLQFTAWWRPLRWRLLLLLWPGIPITLACCSHKTPPIAACIILLAIIGFSALPVTRGIRFAYKLVGAVKYGVVGILQYPDDTALSPDTDNDAVPTGEAQEVTVEILPDSDIIWTLNGTPASWRRI
ncbi:MAG TPA: hypothetical protein VHV83_21010 [Armatimonadota bacterium]|nr:hypothetical protein [Armatimonadota bacterium]